MTRRATIADIAEKAGVSTGAVSYALNGRPGVSETTRRRVLELAAELGWRPNSAARALSAARSGALGLVLARPASTLGVEPFFMKLISGVESTLADRSVALLLQVVADHAEEVEVYRRWWAERRVDGIFLVDLAVDDQRVAVLEESGLPAVVIGGPGHHGSLPAVWSDDADAMIMVVEYLAALGHRRIAYVTGIPDLLHTEVRVRAFVDVAQRVGLVWSDAISTDYSARQAGEVTRRLLSGSPRPTAVLYDNDVMAVTGVSVAHEMGVEVPGEASVVSWEDSLLCRIVHPPLSSLSRDAAAHGALAAERLLALVDGEQVDDVQQESRRLVTRGSTAAPQAR